MTTEQLSKFLSHFLFLTHTIRQGKLLSRDISVIDRVGHTRGPEATISVRDFTQLLNTPYTYTLPQTNHGNRREGRD